MCSQGTQAQYSTGANALAVPVLRKPGCQDAAEGMHHKMSLLQKA